MWRGKRNLLCWNSLNAFQLVGSEFPKTVALARFCNFFFSFACISTPPIADETRKKNFFSVQSTRKNFTINTSPSPGLPYSENQISLPFGLDPV